MVNDSLVLQINKVNVSPDRNRLKYNQAERGKIVDVTVIDNDGASPYDLTGKDIIFNDTKKDNVTIIDGGGGLHSGKFIRTDENDKQGKFSYQFCDYAYQQSGDCQFEFSADSKHIDVSSDFFIDITATGTLKPENTSYVSDLESFKASYNALLQTTSSKTDAWLAQTEKTLDSQVTDKLASLNSDMQDTIKKASDYVNTINTFQEQWNAELKKVTDKATTDTQSAVNAINQKYSDDFAKLQKNFTDWQTQTTTDFNNKAQTILDKVNSASDTTTQLQKQVTDAVNTMQTLMKKLDGYDFTKFVTGEQIKNYVTKDEAKAMMDNAGKVKTVDNIAPDDNGNINTDHFTKSETTQKLAAKLSFVKCDSPQAAYDASKKPASDGSMVIGIYDPNDGPTSAVIGDKTVTISTLNDAITTLQTQVSGLANLQSVVAGKADSATVFLKTDAQTLKQTLENEIANAGKVKTVNNIQPDSNGNITIPAPDLSSKANQSDLNNTNNRVSAIETGYMKKPTVISKADYDKLSTKDPNTLYEITE